MDIVEEEAAHCAVVGGISVPLGRRPCHDVQIVFFLECMVKGEVVVPEIGEGLVGVLVPCGFLDRCRLVVVCV